MAIFISYSRSDEKNANRIAKYFLKKNVHVWIDKWQMGIGDSLREKLGKALSNSSIILALISKNSLNSDWCKNELDIGLLRELEQKSSVLVPVLLDDSRIPDAVAGRLAADFRINFDQAIKDLHDSLLKFTDIDLNRIHTEEFNIDYALDDHLNGDHSKLLINIDSVSMYSMVEYTVYCRITIECIYAAPQKSHRYILTNTALKDLSDFSDKEEMRIVIEGASPYKSTIAIASVSRKCKYVVSLYARRMGKNNAFDPIFDVGSIIRCAYSARDEICKSTDNNQRR